jgi:hypothetical protein
LTVDDDLDASASCDTLELAPSLADTAAPGEDVPLRMERREVGGHNPS